MILGINFILFVANSTALAYVAVIFFALGNGLMWPSFMSILSRRIGTENQGVIRVASSFGSIASIIGLILGGVLYSTIAASTFLISAAVIFLVFILSFRLLNFK